ncbi:unnamed protein product [Coffea canephora]|uniref:Uncharacterized protein n=1 Tax=Coffea canephora TaxID=49390 RepID=A0A068TVA6_COFCA|nr:unnamed protein product [Coffea canephora]
MALFPSFWKILNSLIYAYHVFLEHPGLQFSLCLHLDVSFCFASLVLLYFLRHIYLSQSKLLNVSSVVHFYNHASFGQHLCSCHKPVCGHYL